MRHSRPLSKRKRWVVTEILKKERNYDHDNVGKNSIILDAADVRKLRGRGGAGRAASAGEQELEKEAAAAAASASPDAGGGGGGGGGEGELKGAAAEDRDEGAQGEADAGGLEAPALGAAPQVIGLGPTKPKYASFRGFASAIWGFS